MVKKVAECGLAVRGSYVNWQMPKVEREKLGKWSGWRRVAYKVRNPWSGRGWWVPFALSEGARVSSDRGGRNESVWEGVALKVERPLDPRPSHNLGGTRVTARPWTVGGLRIDTVPPNDGTRSRSVALPCSGAQFCP